MTEAPIADRAPSAAAWVIDPLAAIARPNDRPPYTMSRKMRRTKASSRAAVPRSSVRVRRNRSTMTSPYLVPFVAVDKTDDEQRHWAQALDTCAPLRLRCLHQR